MIKQKIFLLLLCVFFIISSGFCEYSIKVIEQSDARVRIAVQFPIPEITTTKIGNTVYSNIHYAEWPVTVFDNNWQLPYTSEILNLAGKQANGILVSNETTRIKTSEPLSYSIDTPTGIDSSQKDFSAQKRMDMPRITNAVNFSLRYVGDYNGNCLWGLDLYPYHYDAATNELIVTTSMVLDISIAVVNEREPISREDIKTVKEFGAITQAKTREKRHIPGSLAKINTDNSEKWQVVIDKDGFYRVTGKDLSAAGIRLLDIDIKTLQLTNDGKETPIYVQGWKDGQFDKNDYFEFWGESSRQNITQSPTDQHFDPYYKDNIYWLSWGEKKGIWMGEEQGQVNLDPNIQYASPYSFMQTIHVEENKYFDRLNTVQTDSLRDHWFMDDGIKAGRREDYEFELYHPDPQSTQGVSCRLLLCGRASLDTLPHDISAYINKNFIGRGTWWQQNYLDLTSADTQAITGVDLTSGTNKVTIVNNNDAQFFDFVMLNWFEITYPRLYSAQEDFIKFTIPPDNNTGHYLFRLDNFADKNIEIFKLGQNKIVGGTVTGYPAFDDSTLYQVSFIDNVTSVNTEYIAISPDSMLKPLSITRDEPTLLKTTSLAADYVIITHNRFIDLPAMQELLQLRQSQGYHTLIVDVKDIYDEFNYGKPSPYAVKGFLQWAYDNWQAPKLKYVVLIGDGSYVRYTAESDTLDLVPVYMRQTYSFGAAASDHWYTLLDGDNEVSDIHIGRIPARTPEQVEAFLSKMISNEMNPDNGNWRNRLLIIGGNGQVFSEQGRDLSNKAPFRFDTRKLFTYKDDVTGYDPSFGGTVDLLDYFNDGCALMTFHGHGGGAIWADNGLLRLEDCQQIYNQGRLPIILSMTCYTGAFESPSGDALADALLFTEDTGVIGFVGASGFGWTQNDYYLQKEIFNCLFNNTIGTIGELIDAGKTLYYTKHKYLQTVTEINQYHLLGDPATKLVLPSSSTNVAINTQTPQPGDTLKVNCDIPFSNGIFEFTLLDSNRQSIQEQMFNINGSNCSARFVLPNSFSTQTGSIRFYAANSIGTEQINGGVEFSLTGIMFDSSAIVHSTEDSLTFFVKVQSQYPLTIVKCITNYDTVSMKLYKPNWYKSIRNLKLPYYTFEYNYFYTAQAEDGKVFSSKPFVYNMKKGPDLAVDKNSVQISGESNVALDIKIVNNGDSDANRIPVLVQMMSGSSWTTLSTDTISVAAYSTVKVSNAISLPPGKVTLQVYIDPEAKYKDTNRGNNYVTLDLNIYSVNYDPGRGLYYGNTVIDTLAVDTTLSIVIPAEATTQKMVLTVTKLTNPLINEQPDFAFLEDIPGYNISLGKETVSTLKPVQVSFSLPENITVALDSSDKAFDVYSFSSVLQKWIKCNGVRNGNHITASLGQTGPIALIETTDVLMPTVDISINGQPYSHDRYISPEPQFCINLQDVNGININSNVFKVVLDGRQMDHSELSLPDSILNANFISFTFDPKLSTGQHTLSISCSDCNGNILNTDEYVFKTASEFDIKLLGNYPNPFSESTIFGYVFTFPVQEIKLKIYTASGRLIREINPHEISEDPNPYSADYHEVYWDGLDDDGNEIANGVYFYRITAVSGGKTLQVTGKMAKLK